MNSAKVLCSIKDTDLITILCSLWLLLAVKATRLKVGRERGISLGRKLGSSHGGFNDFERWLVFLLPEMINVIHFAIIILFVFLEERKSSFPTTFHACF